MIDARGPASSRAVVALVLTAWAGPAWATCTLVDCEASLTRLDGSAFERLDNDLIIEVGEPFVVRRKCDQSCAVVGGGAPVRSPSQFELSLQRLHRGLPCTTVGEGLRFERVDAFTFRAPEGLPAGRYRIDGHWVNVGPSPDLECPVDKSSWLPPPDVVAPPASTTTTTSFARDWEDRAPTNFEVGAGGWVGVRSGEVSPGGALVFGLHRLVDFARAPTSEKSGRSLDSDLTRWCTPVLCLGVGLFFAPPEVVFGNELGVELRGVVAAPLSGGVVARGGARPFFRFSKGRLRTPSVVGVLLPEVGVHWDSGKGVAFVTTWSIFPIDFRIAGPLTLSVEPLRVGFLAGASGLSLEWGGELTIRYAP